jgi:multidrug efflux pump
VALVAVFIPVAFLTGAVGRLFKEFGITLAVTVALSSFVALTLTPVLCSLILRPSGGKGQGWAQRSFDAFFEGLGRVYEASLRLALRMRPAVILVAVLMVGASIWVFTRLPEELVPIEDRGAAFGIVVAPEGATLDYTDRYMSMVEQGLLNLPERQGLFTATGLGFGGPGRVTNGFLFLKLVPREKRQRTQQEIVQQMFPRLLGIPGVLAFLINPPSLAARYTGADVQFVLQADSYDELSEAVGILMAKASQLGYLVNLDSDLRLNKPELEITIDRERASGLGISVTDIGTTLETFLGGRVVGNFKRGTKQYDVIAQVRAAGRSTPDIIEQVYLRGAKGLVQLANVVRVEESVAPKELNHFNRVRSATITANLAPGASLGLALSELDRIWRNDLPPAIKRDLAGPSREYRESKGTLYFMFVLALVFIYLVLSAQFESFIDPMTILLSVPLAVFGALFSLWVFEQSLNIFSRIGLIMLIGLVTKNAILIVEFSNQLRSRGLTVIEGVVRAARIRLRPILMTSFTTIFGILPIAIGFGAGAESRRPLGIVVVGGVFFSTFLTLMLVPVVYSLLARFTKAERVGKIPEAEDKEGPAEAPPQPDAAIVSP